jgi:ATP-dependent helicase Lhr and Lhr-like helicase
VVERFRDELGDWRVCLLSPFGAQVHAPWAMALERQLTAAGLDPEVMWADDGIVLRLQESFASPGGVRRRRAAPARTRPSVVDELLIDPDEVERLVVDQLAGTALFTTLFREAAGRALLLPKRGPASAPPCGSSASGPRTCCRSRPLPDLPDPARGDPRGLQDVFDLPALRELLTDLRSRRSASRTVDTTSRRRSPSRCCSAGSGSTCTSTTRRWPNVVPRRWRSTATCCASCSAATSCASCSTPTCSRPSNASCSTWHHRWADDDEAQDDRRADLDRRPRRRRAPRRAPPARRPHRDELATASVADPRPRGSTWLLAERRAIEVRVGDEDRIAAAEDAARLRDAIGVALPPGLPQAFTEPVDDPLGDLVAATPARTGRSRSTAAPPGSARPGRAVEATLRWLERQDRVLRGRVPPRRRRREWVDTEVLRRLKRRSLAALRREVEPVDGGPSAVPARLARRARGHGVTPPRSRRAARVVAQLQGAPIPASVLETDVLPARLDGYRPATSTS